MLKPTKPQGASLGIAQLFGEARSFAEANAWKSLSQVCRNVLKMRPSYHAFRVGAGAHLRLDEGQAAERLLLEGIKCFPTKPRLQHLLVQAYVQQNKIGEALNAWHVALTRDPSDNILGPALRKAVRDFDHPEAMRVIDQALQRAPDSAIFLELKADLRAAELMDQALTLAKAEDWAQVAAICQDVVRERPNYQAFRKGAGALLKLDQAEAAERLLVEGIGHFPEKPRLRYLLAEAYAQQNKVAETLDTWRAILDMDPAEAAVSACVKALLQLNEISGAKAIVERVLKKKPRNDVFLKLRAECRIAEALAQAQQLAEAADWQGVAQICQDVVSEGPNYLAYRMGAGALLRLDQAEAAERLLKEAVEHFPTRPRLQHLLALAYGQQGKGRESLDIWLTAISMESSDDFPSVIKKAANAFELFPEIEELVTIALARAPNNVALLRVRAAFAERKYSIWRDRADVFEQVKQTWASIARADPADPLAKVVNASLNEGHDEAIGAWCSVKDNAGDNAAALTEVASQLVKILKGLDAHDLIIEICESVEPILRNANRETPLMRELITVYAQSLVKQRKPTEARAVLKSSGFELSESASDRLLLADIDFQEREFDKALNCARSVLELSPRHHKAHGMVLRSLTAKKHHEEAQRYLDDLEMQGLMDLEQLGKLAEASGQMRHAERYYSRMIEEQSGSAEALRPYTGLLYRTGQWGTLEALAAKHATPFKSNWYLRNVLEDVSTLSRIAGDPLSSSNAIGMICDEFLRRAPQHTRLAENELPKVAIIIGSLGPGGAERQCQLLCQQLARARQDKRIADVRLFVANLSRSPRDSFYLRSVEGAGISVVEYLSRRTWIRPEDFFGEESASLASLLQPANRRQQVMQLSHHLREFDPNIVHAWLDTSIFAAGLATAYLPKARLVGRWGSLPPTVQRVSSPREKDHAAVLQIAYRALSHMPWVQFSSNSRATADVYADWIGVPRSEILVVKNGVDFSSLKKSDEARQRIRAELGIPQQSVVIGTAIRLGSEKRPFMWLDIAERVASQRGTAEFIIVGDGPLAEELKEKSEQLRYAKVRLVGRQSNMADWYSAMDVTLMTSSVEGLSNTVIESAYMGLPVVAFDVGGMTGAVVDEVTGFLAPESDLDRMVADLVRLTCESDLRARMGESATQYAVANFDPAKMAESVLEIYNDLLKRS